MVPAPCVNRQNALRFSHGNTDIFYHIPPSARAISFFVPSFSSGCWKPSCHTFPECSIKCETCRDIECKGEDACFRTTCCAKPSCSHLPMCARLLHTVWTSPAPSEEPVFDKWVTDILDATSLSPSPSSSSSSSSSASEMIDMDFGLSPSPLSQDPEWPKYVDDEWERSVDEGRDKEGRNKGSRRIVLVFQIRRRDVEVV